MVKAEEPFRLLLAGLQVYESGSEGGSVKLLELLKHDLCLLAIGRVPGKEVKALPGGDHSSETFDPKKKVFFAEPPAFLTFAFFTSSGVASI